MHLVLVFTVAVGLYVLGMIVLTVAVGLYVLGMIVLALAAILGSVRRNRELKKPRLTV